MTQGVDLNQIKQYNASLKSYKEKAANINAQIEYATKELDSLCRELSEELGVEVNVSNIEQIYKEQTEKINSALQSGNIVLSKIAAEESALSSGVTLEQTATVQQPILQASQPVPPVINEPMNNIGLTQPLFKLG